MNRRSCTGIFPTTGKKDNVPYSIMRDGDWKLIKRYEGTECELYNLTNDFSENEDLLQTNPKKVREFDQKLMKWLERVDAGMPKQKAQYVSME